MQRLQNKCHFPEPKSACGNEPQPRGGFRFIFVSVLYYISCFFIYINIYLYIVHFLIVIGLTKTISWETHEILTKHLPYPLCTPTKKCLNTWTWGAQSIPVSGPGPKRANLFISVSGPVPPRANRFILMSGQGPPRANLFILVSGPGPPKGEPIYPSFGPRAPKGRIYLSSRLAQGTPHPPHLPFLQRVPHFLCGISNLYCESVVCSWCAEFSSSPWGKMLRAAFLYIFCVRHFLRCGIQ